MKHQNNKKNVFGPAIRNAREASRPKVTQSELSARLEIRGLVIDRSAISRIEKQERYLMDYELVEIADALRIPLQKLIR